MRLSQYCKKAIIACPLALILYATLCIGTISLFDSEFTLRPQSPSTAVVFFSEFGNSEGLSKETILRLEDALTLFKDGLIERFVVVGGARKESNRFGGKLMAKYLARRGISEDLIRADLKSYDTNTNLKAAQKLCEPGDIKNRTYISDPLHLLRIRFLLDQLPNVRFYASERSSRWSTLFVVKRVTHELVAYLAYALIPSEQYAKLVHWYRESSAKDLN